LFRERQGDAKDGTWGFLQDRVPGFDHVGLHLDNTVYESHPGYPPGRYLSADGGESRLVASVSGVQSQHSHDTFEHSSTSASTPVIGFDDLAIDPGLALRMRDAIDTVRTYKFGSIDLSSLDGLESTLAPAIQKGSNGSFTCVGLVEWAAEAAGHNQGQGFISNMFESLVVPDPRASDPPRSIEIPLLSPLLLNFAIRGAELLQGVPQWLQGLVDPVDFLITDPLGRRLGFTQAEGLVNEIPRAFFSGDGGVEQFLLPQAVPGRYRIKFVGVGAEVFAAFGSSGSSDSFLERLAVGEIREKEFQLPQVVGSAGDVNRDGRVDVEDAGTLATRVGQPALSATDPGDLDGDGLISATDGALLMRLIEVLTPDTLPPTVTCSASPDTLWPPNGNMVSIDVSVSVEDSISGPAGFRLVSVASNEPGPDQIQGFMPGKPSTTGQLRAERSGFGTGRIYTLTYEGADKAGNAATCTTTVVVHHDQGEK
jgi:hypothetical protein